MFSGECVLSRIFHVQRRILCVLSRIFHVQRRICVLSRIFHVQWRILCFEENTMFSREYYVF